MEKYPCVIFRCEHISYGVLDNTKLINGVNIQFLIFNIDLGYGLNNNYFMLHKRIKIYAFIYLNGILRFTNKSLSSSFLIQFFVITIAPFIFKSLTQNS